ncbi:TolC family protein [Arcobacter vandammei]|uniref:TolC family protein n=1 Tax=Arcobacter vandammei TaxID=2782243 RepID=UPI0018DF10AD|nr:TolC family protein [Arcobacter vandammei]
MKKIIIYSIFCSFALANPNNLDILQKDKKEYRDLDKKSIETKYESLRNDWIGTLDFSSGLTTTHSFDNNKNGNFGKNAKIGFTQSIFESGGIEFKIDYAKDKLKYDLLSWENQNYQILYSIYNTLLEIKKLKLEMTQNDIRVVNKDIEQIIKKIQYDAGKVDIIELNNAIMSKNLILKEKISLENSLKEKEQELAKYTDLKYDEIEIMDFKEISKEDFLNKNLALMQEDAKIDMLNTDYKKKKTEYLPKVALSTNASYSNSDESFNRTIKDTNKDDASANVGLTLSMPLFDYNKTSKLEESKLEVLKQRAYLNDLKNETAYDYEQTLTKLDTYFKQNETIRKNIELYEELISANKISNESGMTSTYDLEILENTKLINDFDILLNDISIVQQYAKLYFKIKG